MSNIVPIDTARIPAVLATQDLGALSTDLTAGAEGSFPVLSIRGSRFRVKQGGEETVLTNDDGDPRGSLEVVLVKAHNKLSKIYYQQNYTEGDDAEPDCFSTDGEMPSAEASNPQAPSCAACPHNKWGSRITDAGKKSKACSDSRRTALAPAGDIGSSPMLLRVPAASLASLAEYGKKLGSKGIPYNAVVTKLSFDAEVSYPKLVFSPARIVTAEEAAQVAAHLHGDTVERILDSSEVTNAGVPATTGAPIDTAPPPPPPEDDFDRIAKEMESATAPAAAPPNTPAQPAAPPPQAAATAAPAPQTPVAEGAAEPPKEDPAVSASEPDLDALLDAI